MITPTAEDIAARKRGFQRRTPWALLAFALIITAALTPTILVEAALPFYGRNLFSASRFFLTATPGGPAFAEGTSLGAVGFGLSVTYVGLAMQQIGSLIGVGTFWVLIAEDVGKWIRRLVMLAGVLLILSAGTILFGYHELQVANLPTLLGVAWVFNLVAGVILFVGGRLAKSRLITTWFLSRAEVIQP